MAGSNLTLPVLYEELMLGALTKCFGVNLGHEVLMNYTLIKKKKRQRGMFVYEPKGSLVRAR